MSYICIAIVVTISAHQWRVHHHDAPRPYGGYTDDVTETDGRGREGRMEGESR